MFFKHIDIVKGLYYGKTASLNELSISVGRSIPYVTKAVTDLINLNVVKEIGIGTSTGGRKPVTYSLIADIGFIISVAMSQFVTRVVITDMNNEFVGKVQEFQLKLNDDSNAIHSLVTYIKTTIINSGLPQDKFLAIGITMPGFIDAFQGNNLSFLKSSDDTTLVTYITKQVELPVFIENDSTAIALAEQKFGLPIARNNSMIINLGWGIGLGMIINKEIFKGHSGFAGEFSHLPLHKNGKLCSCGKQGCLETEASLLAIEAKATEGLKQGQVSSLMKYDII